MKIRFISVAILLTASIIALGSYGARAQTATLNIVAPNGGECLTPGITHTISWTSGGSVGYFKLFYAVGGESPILIAELPANIAMYQWTVPTISSADVRIILEAWSASYRLLASDVSDEPFSVSGGCSSAPSAPAGFGATLGTGGIGVNLSWEDTSVNENEFRIFRRPQGNTYWTHVTNVDANIAALYLREEGFVGTYEYHVKACSSYYGCSAESNIASVTFASPYPTPSPSPSPSPSPLASPSPSPYPSPSPSPSPSPQPSPSQTPTPTANSYIEVTILDAFGQRVNNAHAHIYTIDLGLHYYATSDTRGSFRLAIPAGAYVIEIFPPMGRTDLIKPKNPSSFRTDMGETETIELRFGSPVKTVAGTIFFSTGKPIIDAEVNAYNQTSGQWIPVSVDGAGTYTLRLGPGKWLLGLRPLNPNAAQWRWAEPPKEVEFADNENAETKTVHFIVPFANAKVNARVLDEAGRAIANAGVVLDTASAALPPDPTKPRISEFRKTGSDGLASFLIPQGTYYLRVMVPYERGFLNADEERLVLSTGDDRQITVTLKSRITAAASATITGTAKLSSGAPVDAYIWAWSENGGSVETRALSNGAFTLPVSIGERWWIGARKEVNGLPYKSSDTILDVKSTPIPMELVLINVSTTPLPPAVKVSQSSTQQIIAQAKDGAKIILPSNAAPMGTVTVEVKPTIEAPPQSAADVMSTVYDISIKDQKGNAVRELQQEADIVIPYSEDILAEHGTKETALVPAYFDETTKTWVKLDSFTIDKEKNVVIAKIKHLTRFALVAAVDITPPSAPSNVSVSPSGTGKALLRWLNPVTDFRYSKIYRSTKSGTLGSVAHAQVFTTSQEDTGLAARTTYYYTVRAVDPAGNESVNTNQVVFTSVSGAAQPTTGIFTMNLRYGMRNSAQVRLLQQTLKDLGFYTGPVTGNYYTLTRAAVIRFQEAYASEILAPYGFTKGVGYVGPSTRAKLNSLIGR